MKNFFFLGLVIVGGYLLPHHTYALEEPGLKIEQSAEVFLDDYSDDFQENFFEGLKQKGIQNYDRAIHKFLECQSIASDNDVVAHELAKCYLLDKQFSLAQASVLASISAKPDNYWYAYTLISILQARNAPLDEVKQDLPWKNVVLRKNIAEICFKKRNYHIAQSVLKGLPNPSAYADLKAEIAAALADAEKKYKTKKSTVTTIKDTSVSTADKNDASQYKSKIKVLLEKEASPESIVQLAEEALESYPSQPYFYYAHGFALNRMNRGKQAIELLETALDYVVSDIPLSNKIYEELAKSYLALDNPTKAAMFTKKIRP